MRFTAAAAISLALWMAFFLITDAQAEGRCPDGFFPIGGGDAGWEGCAPMGPADDTNLPKKNYQPRWETRWGAIAIGGGSGFGAVTGEVSELAASRTAIKQCMASADGDPSDCEAHTFFNQCAAYAWGGGKGHSVSAVDMSTASSKAMSLCSQYSSECKVYYAGCSYAERVD